MPRFIIAMIYYIVFRHNYVGINVISGVTNIFFGTNRPKTI